MYPHSVYYEKSIPVYGFENKIFKNREKRSKQFEALQLIIFSVWQHDECFQWMV